MFRSNQVGLFSITITLLAACSAGSGSAGTNPNGESPQGTKPSVQSCTVAGRTGKSTCSEAIPVPGAPPSASATCSAGTFCYSSSGSAKCQPGCQSDENCGPSERCVRCGDQSSAGVCRPCNLTDEDACKPKEKPDAAPASCERDTFFDRECGTGGKAFNCPNNLEPTGQGTCTQTDVPGVWCCGAGLKDPCDRDTTFDMPLCQGKKAYRCGPSDEPSDDQCTQSPQPDVWCCPK